jgi:hypothetical protein
LKLDCHQAFGHELFLCSSDQSKHPKLHRAHETEILQHVQFACKCVIANVAFTAPPTSNHASQRGQQQQSANSIQCSTTWFKLLRRAMGSLENKMCSHALNVVCVCVVVLFFLKKKKMVKTATLGSMFQVDG